MSEKTATFRALFLGWILGVVALSLLNSLLGMRPIDGATQICQQMGYERAVKADGKWLCETSTRVEPKAQP